MLKSGEVNFMKMTIENLEFPLSIKNKLMRIKDISKLELDFKGGKNIIFDNTNMAIKEPHKIIISNKDSSIILLVYENDEQIYTMELHAIPLSKISNIIVNLNSV